MQGVIQKKEFSKSGAPKFQVGSQWYFLNRNTQPQDFPIGTALEFEFEEFGDDRGRGRPKAITVWKAAPQGTLASSYTAGPDALIMPFLSNTIAHAIQAGLIKTPPDLKQWVLSARSALIAKASEEGELKEDFDEDLPF